MKPDPLSTEHRWSGWPGAWCLDCGTGDMREACLAMHPEHEIPCELCVNNPCPWPGEGRFNPYKTAPVVD